MAKWLVYGSVWFATEVECDSEDEAQMLGLLKLMDCETVRFNVEYVESELSNA